MSHRTAAKCSRSRGQRGSLVALIPAAILIIVIGIGAFALDVSHNVSVRTELQNATDAAALAGGRDLLEDKTMNDADNDALSVAEGNTADGAAVANSTPGDTVTTQTQFDASSNSGTYTVDGSRVVSNTFSKLFGHNSDTVVVHSQSQAWRSITGLAPNQGFPLAVSLTTKNGNGKAINDLNIGDTFNIELNSQQYKNAAWTSFSLKNTNASWLNQAMAMLFGLSPMEAGFIPGLNAGDPLNLTNGIASQKDLAKEPYYSAILNAKQLVLPCMEGNPPYNQSRSCVGFITVDVTNVIINQQGGQVETFVCKLVKGAVKGTGGIPESGSNGTNTALLNNSAGTVKLIQ